MKRLILVLLFAAPAVVLAQVDFESWSTIKATNVVGDRVVLALEGEHRFNYEQNHTRYFHTDFGLIFGLTDKLKIGGFIREIYEIKSGQRVREVRPHLDLFYSLSGTFKIRMRNDYQIKEFAENKIRLRLRPTYTYALNDVVKLYTQSEVFITTTAFVRNRFNVGFSFKINDSISIAPSWLLESNREAGGWSNINVCWIFLKIKT